MTTLWDLLPLPAVLRARQKPAPPPAPQPIARPAPSGDRVVVRREIMAERYERVRKDMLATYGIRVRRYRTSMTGVAWQLMDGSGAVVSKLIEAPRPKGPMSAAVFLHEIGHHAIGFRTYSPRCLEEYHAWAWALDQMERQGLNVTPAVRRRMHESLWYALDKARRRGLKSVPPELIPFQTLPAR
jgi:hypothetical protein